MTPDHEHITPENVDERIQRIVQRDQWDASVSAETRLIQDLDRFYHSEEGIMARTWARLREQHPEIDNLRDETSTLSSRVLPFPQKLEKAKTASKGWKQRASILLAVAISLMVIGASFLLFHESQIVPPAHKSVPEIGPLQLLDRNGQLFYQTDGRKTLTFGDGNYTADFVQYSIQQLTQDLHVTPAKLETMGLRVTTTLDLAVQDKTYRDAQLQIAKVKATKHITDSAIVVLDYHTGAIIALIGSLNEHGSGFNVATQNGRQPGNAFKPFVYATAFAQGISPGDVVDDVQTSFPPYNYTPQNYDGQFHGLISYRTALQNSYNIPVLKLMQQMQIVPTVKNIQALGMSFEQPASQYTLPVALGASEAPLLDTTVAYGTIANRGVHVAPNSIESVIDSNGHTLFQARTQGTSVLSPAAAFMTTDVLSDKNNGLSSVTACTPMVLYSTSQAQCLAGNPGIVRPAAVTWSAVDSFRDLWAIGYTSDYVVGTWSGNDDNSLMVNATPPDGAAQIWHDAMMFAEGNAPIQQFPGPPATVVKKTVSEQGITTTDWHLK